MKTNSNQITRYVCGFAFHVGEVLLIEKQRPVFQKGKWNGVGGHIEEGETDEEAMCREFAEETGVTIDGWEHFCTLGGKQFEVVFFRNFLTEKPITVQMTDEAIKWHSLIHLPNTLPNLNWLIPMAIHEVLGHGIPFYINEA